MAGLVQEGRRWLESGLVMGGAVAETVRAKALNSLADITIMLGDYDKSHALLEESLSHFRAAGRRKRNRGLPLRPGLAGDVQGDLPLAN